MALKSASSMKYKDHFYSSVSTPGGWEEKNSSKSYLNKTLQAVFKFVAARITVVLHLFAAALKGQPIKISNKETQLSPNFYVSSMWR